MFGDEVEGYCGALEQSSYDVVFVIEDGTAFLVVFGGFQKNHTGGWICSGVYAPGVSLLDLLGDH